MVLGTRDPIPTGLPSRKLHPRLRIHFKLSLTSLPKCLSGVLKYGVPGSGKASLIQCIAGELNLGIYILSLSRSGLADDGLRKLISYLPARCIVLIEDIDVAFHRTLNREPHKKPSARISLSGLLNALDGVGAKEGRLLFATASRYEALDPALRRPGRIDYLVEFKLASRYQAGELFKNFYHPTPRTSPYKDSSTSKDEGGNHKRSNPGYGPAAEHETEKFLDLESLTNVQCQPLAAIYHRGERGVEVTAEELDVLVERFRELIPERVFSMAALQGYLMMHKNQPRQAAECAGKWVREEMANMESGSSSWKED